MPILSQRNAKDELENKPAVPPWFTACAVPFLRGAFTPLVTNVYLHVAAYLAFAFWCALDGPFDVPLSSRLTPSRARSARAGDYFSVSLV